MASFGFGWEAFEKSGTPCFDLSAALNPCPVLKEGEGLVERGPCSQEPKVSKCKQTRDALTLTSLPKEDCDVLERAQDPESVRSKFYFCP